MATLDKPLDTLRAVSRTAAFNQWCGIEVLKAEPGLAEISVPWRPEFGQYANFLHAGVVGGAC